VLVTTARARDVGLANDWGGLGWNGFVIICKCCFIFHLVCLDLQVETDTFLVL